MKLLTFQLQGSEYLGALTDAGVVNLSAAAPGEIAFSSMQQFIEAGQPALDRAYALLASDPASTPSDQLDWLAPLPIPAQIRDCLGFEEHLKNAFESAIKLSAMAADDPVKAEQEFRASGRFTAPEVWYQQPLYYKGNRFSVAPSGKDIVWPAYSEVMDFELEMACVIGKKVRTLLKAMLKTIYLATRFTTTSQHETLKWSSPKACWGPPKAKILMTQLFLGQL